jgi:oligoendopeptidase F
MADTDSLELPTLVDWKALDWNDHQPLIDILLNETLRQENVVSWLERWSDLVKIFEEASAEVYHRSSADVSDEAAQGQFEHFLEVLQPQIETANQALKAKLVTLEGFVPPTECAELLRRFRHDFKRADEAFLDSQADLEIRAGEFAEIVGGISVNWRDQECTLGELEHVILEPDRATREAVWRTTTGAWAGCAQALDELFQDLLTMRYQLAKHAGFPDYRAFRWQELERLDYHPEDCLALHNAIETEIVPLSKALLERRRQQLGLERLRPWDRLCDPLGQPALRPCANATELKAVAARVFEHLDPQFSAWYSSLETGWLDLETRANKAPGSFCVMFPKTGLPFIFMNATGTHADLMMLFHECGHAFHALASSEAQSLIWNTEGPVEFCELAAVSLEWLALTQFETAGVYSSVDAQRARHEALEQLVMDLPRLAASDAFQHWVYTQTPQPSTDAIQREWIELSERFAPGLDWTGLEETRTIGWLTIGHHFETPFYMFEYILAGLGAVQIWKNALEEPIQALKAYRTALRLGYTRNLPELYAAAEAPLHFDREGVRDLAAWLKQELML